MLDIFLFCSCFVPDRPLFSIFFYDKEPMYCDRPKLEHQFSCLYALIVNLFTNLSSFIWRPVTRGAQGCHRLLPYIKRSAFNLASPIYSHLFQRYFPTGISPLELVTFPAFSWFVPFLLLWFILHEQKGLKYLKFVKRWWW